MRYSVTVEPENREAYPSLDMVRSIVDADDKDAALNSAEAAYRRRYPGTGKLNSRLVRVRLGRTP